MKKKVKETKSVKKEAKPSKHPKLKKGLIISSIVLGSIVGLLFLAWGGINTFKFVVYKDFYSISTRVATIPGLNSGAVPQGITCYNGGYIMSMYMKDNKSPSRLYVMNKDGSSRYIELYEDENFTKPCIRHCGGVQYVESINKLYVADAKQYVFEVDISKVKDTSINKIAIQNVTQVDNEASSIFSDNKYVYVSEFHRDNTDWTTQESHKITYNNESHRSYISVFPIEGGEVDFSKDPKLIYSIPDMVQGVAIKDNILYTTSSWGVASSHLRYYNMNNFADLGTLKGVQTYFVTSSSCTKDLKCPPMFEDLDFNSDGKLITYNESASNKYIFGKFFFADKIYAIKVN